MATQTALDDRVRASGEHEGASLQMDADDDRLTVTVDRRNLGALTAAEFARVEVHLAVNGGPFRLLGSVGFGGLDLVNQSGPVDDQVTTFWIPWKSRSKQVRLRLVSSRALRTSVLAETGGNARAIGLGPTLGAPPRSVAIDSSGSIAESTSATSLSADITVGNNPDRWLFGVVGQNCFNNAPKTISAFTFNGDSLTLGKQNLSGDNCQLDVYQLQTPDVATGALAVTFTAAASNVQLGYIAVYNASALSSWGEADGGSAGATASATVASSGYTDGLGLAFFCGAGAFACAIAPDDGSVAYEFEREASAVTVLYEAGNAGGHSMAATATGTLTYIAAVAVGVAAATLSVEQEGFRFRADDGSESGASPLAAQDTDITRAKDTNTRLRALLNATGDPPSTKWKLQSRKVGDLVFHDVPLESEVD